MRAVVIALLLATARVAAQPSPPDGGGDTSRAKELYQSAEAAMAAQDYETAARDYGAAYEISRDPVLFYKIGTAHERAGKCPVAVIYYRRYIAEGKPTPAFIDITNARIRACEPDAPVDAAPPPVDKVEPPPKADAPKEPPPKEAPPRQESPKEDEPKTAMGGFVGSKDKDKGGKGEVLTSRNRGAWLFVTGSIALITVGAVLAYSADSAEQDIKDLYVGLGGNPPVFDRATKDLYEDMIAEGERYERLSWISFGLAGATAGAAAFLFWREHQRGKHEAPVVTPTVTKDGAGVRAVFSF